MILGFHFTKIKHMKWCYKRGLSNLLYHKAPILVCFNTSLYKRLVLHQQKRIL